MDISLILFGLGILILIAETIIVKKIENSKTYESNKVFDMLLVGFISGCLIMLLAFLSLFVF